MRMDLIQPFINSADAVLAHRRHHSRQSSRADQRPSGGKRSLDGSLTLGAFGDRHLTRAAVNDQRGVWHLGSAQGRTSPPARQGGRLVLWGPRVRVAGRVAGWGRRTNPSPLRGEGGSARQASAAGWGPWSPEPI